MSTGFSTTSAGFGSGPRAHIFEDGTGDAYDTTQCDESIRNGDVLVVSSEGVVGIMLEAWPTAITAEHGHFHALLSPEPGETYDTIWANMSQVGGGTKDYTASLEMARAFMKALNFKEQDNA